MYKWFNWFFTDAVPNARAESEGFAPLSDTIKERVLNLLKEVCNFILIIIIIIK